MQNRRRTTRLQNSRFLFSFLKNGFARPEAPAWYFRGKHMGQDICGAPCRGKTFASLKSLAGRFHPHSSRTIPLTTIARAHVVNLGKIQSKKTTFAWLRTRREQRFQFLGYMVVRRLRTHIYMSIFQLFERAFCSIFLCFILSLSRPKCDLASPPCRPSDNLPP